MFIYYNLIYCEIGKISPNLLNIVDKIKLDIENKSIHINDHNINNYINNIKKFLLKQYFYTDESVYVIYINKQNLCKYNNSFTNFIIRIPSYIESHDYKYNINNIRIYNNEINAYYHEMIEDEYYNKCETMVNKIKNYYEKKKINKLEELWDNKGDIVGSMFINKRFDKLEEIYVNTANWATQISDPGNKIIKYYYMKGIEQGDTNLGYEVWYNPHTFIIRVCDTYSTVQSILTCDDDNYMCIWKYEGDINNFVDICQNKKDMKINDRFLNIDDIDYDNIIHLYENFLQWYITTE